MHATPTIHLIRWLSRQCIVSSVRICRMLGFIQWQVTFLADLPAPSQPLIFVSNHIEWHDAPFIGWAIPKRYELWWFAKAELFDHWMGWWFRCLPMIPVRRGRGDKTAVASAITRVNACSPLVVFPEGTWDDGRMVRAKTGIVRIALATNAWIIPIGLTGPQQPLWFQTRTMTVGAAFRLNQLPSYIPDVDNDMQHLSALTTDVMHRITALLPSEYHGYYAHTP